MHRQDVMWTSPRTRLHVSRQRGHELRAHLKPVEREFSSSAPILPDYMHLHNTVKLGKLFLNICQNAFQSP